MCKQCGAIFGLGAAWSPQSQPPIAAVKPKRAAKLSHALWAIPCSAFVASAPILALSSLSPYAFLGAIALGVPLALLAGLLFALSGVALCLLLPSTVVRGRIGAMLGAASGALTPALVIGITPKNAAELVIFCLVCSLAGALGGGVSGKFFPIGRAPRGSTLGV